LLIDIGANLAHESFERDFGALLQRARSAGVVGIVVTGSSTASNEQALVLARGHHDLYCTAGLHPHHADEWSDELGARIAELAGTEPKLVALGECGLDYFRDLSPRESQRRAFVAQIELAIAAGKPLFLHQRDAHADFLAILREHRAALVDCVVHCFTDTAEALDDYLALDCHIGITGWICDERRSAHLIEAVRRIPATRLMIETDSPYLVPRTMKPQPKDRRNEPAFLPWVARAIAAARGEDEATIAAATTATAQRFFRLPH
jgi:TatD DNase family protein